MKNKAFTLMELIIVIAILAIIMLIGIVAYSGILERMKVRADKATASEIGKAIVVREVDIGKEKGVELYPTLTVYDQLEEIDTYIAKDIKPQSMKEGNFIVTALQTENGKKILVGIGKEGDQITNKPYTNGKEAGWAYSENLEITEFLEENKEKLEEGVILPGSGGGGNGNQEAPETSAHSLTVGINKIITTTLQKESEENITVKAGGTYTEWEISGISETNPPLNFNMPENDVRIIGITE